jgi:hypothetical protein
MNAVADDREANNENSGGDDQLDSPARDAHPYSHPWFRIDLASLNL